MNTLRKIYFLILKKITFLNRFEFISKITQKLIYDFLKDRYFNKKKQNSATHLNSDDILLALKEGCYYHIYEHIEINERDYDELIVDYMNFNLKDHKYKITICFKEAQLTIHRKKIYKLQ